MPGPMTPILLVILGPCTLKEHQMSTLEKDCSYLANLNGKDLEEKLLILTYYTRCASAVLAIGGAGH